jgi:signal transduction histidine kinase
MTGLFWLDWAMLAVSLFNALLLLWLGLTVFFTADRRVWGIWLSSAGLLLGALFFISHSAILGNGISVITPGLNFWWRLGWIPVAALPFMWYMAVLWYTGFWDHLDGKAADRGELYRRQIRWFVFAVLFGLVLIGLLGFANPLPSLGDLADDRLAAAPEISGIPVLILAYPLFTMLCMGLSIDALRHPETSGRLLGELARERARRWLTATSLVLLGVSLLVGWVMVWIVNNSWQGIFQSPLSMIVGWFDLLIAGLIAVSILLLGQAVVSYEVFTGKILPRRGLARYWRRAVILAAGFSLLASASLVMGLRPIYTLLLSAVIMITFFALLGWRAYVERERLIENLRPFAASQKMIDNLLDERSSASHVRQNDELFVPFQALCVNVLGTDQAGLFPYGPLALLAGGASFFPPESAFTVPNLDDLAARLQDSVEIGLALEPGDAGGMIFAVPLWREGGLSGVIFLGQKRDGGPYTQEEIEIAQATGERLIDARVSEEMARRLITLQRQHLVAGQVIDQRVRRKVHDEILPQVHTAMLDLISGGETQSGNGKVLELLEEVHTQLSNLLGSMPSATAPEVARAGLVRALRRTVEDELEAAFDKVDWQIEPQTEALVRDLPPLIAEVVYSAVREGLRNAARHGRGVNGQSPLYLQITMKIDEENRLHITIEDNGVGFGDKHAWDSFMGEQFRDGVSLERAVSKLENGGHSGESWQQDEIRSALGSSGQGLALHSTLMAVIGGSLTVSSHPGQYTRLMIDLPQSAWGK